MKLSTASGKVEMGLRPLRSSCTIETTVRSHGHRLSMKFTKAMILVRGITPGALKMRSAWSRTCCLHRFFMATSTCPAIFCCLKVRSLGLVQVLFAVFCIIRFRKYVGEFHGLISILSSSSKMASWVMCPATAWKATVSAFHWYSRALHRALAHLKASDVSKSRLSWPCPSSGHGSRRNRASCWSAG